MTEPKFTVVGFNKTLKATFSIAVNRRRRRSENELDRIREDMESDGREYRREYELFEKKTIWKPCIAWDKLAEHIQEYGKKGVRISASGDEDVEIYTKDGETVKRQFLRLRLVSIFNLDKMNGTFDDDGLGRTMFEN